jgi:phospholipase D-like protein
MTSRKSWADLSPTQRKAVVAGAAVEMVLTTWSLRDLRRRPAEAVRGPKTLWRASFVVQPFGPLAYLAFGRR